MNDRNRPQADYNMNPLRPQTNNFIQSRCETVEIPDALQTIVDETDPDNVYIGEAQCGIATSEPHWRIQNIKKNASITTVRWARLETKFESCWDDRQSYTYG